MEAEMSRLRTGSAYGARLLIRTCEVRSPGYPDSVRGDRIHTSCSLRSSTLACSSYNGHRPHRSLELRAPRGPTVLPAVTGGHVVRRTRVHGLINEYSGQAA